MFPDVLPEGTTMVRFEDEGGDARRINFNM
jgi:hypothetical protein